MVCAVDAGCAVLLTLRVWHVLLPDRHSPNESEHPAQMLFVEDVYYFSLIFQSLQGAAVTLVTVPMSEWDKGINLLQVPPGKWSRLAPLVQGVHVFHDLKSDRRFEWIERQQQYRSSNGLTSLLHPSRTVLRCDQDDGIAGLASSLAHELQETAGCCGMWRMCFMAMPNSSWRPRLSHNFDRTLWRGW